MLIEKENYNARLITLRYIHLRRDCHFIPSTSFSPDEAILEAGHPKVHYGVRPAERLLHDPHLRQGRVRVTRGATSRLGVSTRRGAIDYRR